MAKGGLLYYQITELDGDKYAWLTETLLARQVSSNVKRMIDYERYTHA